MIISTLALFLIPVNFYLPDWVALQIVFQSLALLGINLPQDEEESAFGGAIHPISAQDKDGGSANIPVAEGFVDEEGGDDADEPIPNPTQNESL